MKLEVIQLEQPLGALVYGWDPRQRLNTDDCINIRRGLREYSVLIFRGHNQPTDSELVNFAKNFGKIEPPHPVYPHVNKYPEIVLLENDKNNPPDTDVWHTDVTFKPNPPFASILYSKIIPESGGDTLWSCLSRIYDELPKDLKKHLETLKAVHDMGDFRNSFVLESL